MKLTPAQETLINKFRDALARAEIVIEAGSITLSDHHAAIRVDTLMTNSDYEPYELSLWGSEVEIVKSKKYNFRTSSKKNKIIEEKKR